MCGIFCFIGKNLNKEKLIQASNAIQARGPDNSQHMVIHDQLFFSFHRLSINGLDQGSNQPLVKDKLYLICNGEIFNYKELINKYSLNDVYMSHSDCEIILHLYEKIGFEKMCLELDGEFAFVLYDQAIEKTFVARDHLGIRSLYIGIKENNNNNDYEVNDDDNNTDSIHQDLQTNIIISSELKGIDKSYQVEQFPPRFYLTIDNQNLQSRIYKEYFQIVRGLQDDDYEEDENQIIRNIYIHFYEAVKKRLLSDRNIGCLLSGGLDSTSVVALVSQFYEPFTLNTYSIGLKGSIDLQYAQDAANYFQTKHTNIELSNDEFLNAIDKTIKQIESYDVTTVRASVGNYLVSLYIRDHSDDKVIFCGDVSDEIFGSYRGFYYADNDDVFFNENLKMIQNIHYFDVLRSDRSISGAGLEARVPFSDKSFVQYVMKIHPKLKQFNNGKMEKYLFRKAFEHILPEKLAWRSKTAFSDGVGSSDNQWFQVLKNYMEDKYSDDEYLQKIEKFNFNKPYDKESLYYREIFEKYYPNKEKTIPYYWKQPFMNQEDPSAWQVENYSEIKN